MWKYGQPAFATSRTFFRATFDNGFAHRFSVSLGSFGKKEITTNSFAMDLSNTREKTAKNWSSERFVSLTDEDVERFVEAEASKSTQRKMHSDVVLMKSFLPKENETIQLQDHTTARIRCLPQQICIACEKKSLVMNMNQKLSEELSLLWSVIWKTYATASLLSKDNVRQLNQLFERYLFKRISQFRDDTVVQFVCRLRKWAASYDFAEFKDVIGHIWG